MSFYLQPHTQPAPDIQSCTFKVFQTYQSLSTEKCISWWCSALKTWSMTGRLRHYYNNGVCLVTAARSKASSPASHGSLSLPCLPRPVVIPSAFNAIVKLYCLPTVLHFIPPLTYIIVAAALLSACLHYAKKDSTFQRIFLLGLNTAPTWPQVPSSCGAQCFTPSSLHRYTLSVLSLLFWHVLLEQENTNDDRGYFSSYILCTTKSNLPCCLCINFFS